MQLILFITFANIMMKYKKIQQASFLLLIILMVGLGLQSFLGAFPLGILSYPANVILVLLLLFLSILICRLLPEHKITRFLASGTAALSSLLFIGILSIILGLTLQTNDTHITDIPARLGIREMTSYYPFILSYLYLVITLSFATFRRLKWEVSSINICFFLNHAGLLIVLFSLGFGTADKLQLRARVQEDGVIHKALAQSGKEYDLPFRLKLIDFQMETYLPKLAIIDDKTGKFLPEGSPEFYDVDSTKHTFSLQHQSYRMLTYLDNAAPDKNGSYMYKKDDSLPPAVLIRLASGNQGWITCGNQQVPYKMLVLPNNQAMVMMSPEAKAYSSLVQIKQDGVESEHLIEVNKPLHLGPWSVYQSSFDDKQGKASTISIFQFIYDPWKILTQIGLTMLVLGALSLFWKHQQKH